MKKLYLMSALTLACALASVGGAAARSQATTVRTAAEMTAGEERPAPKGEVSAARGSFTATLSKSAAGATMTWRLEFSNLTGDATAAHVHVAARGEPGPVRVPLCAPCTSGASGTANVDAAVLEAIQNDRAYVNVHTRTNAPGEIRGQLSTVATARVTLRASQERPRPKGKVRLASGVFNATVTKSGDSAIVEWRLTFKKLTGRAVAAHIHSGARGKAGPVVVPLCAPCRNGARGRATVDAAVLSTLESGRAYVNIHTKRNPKGEIRAQIAALPLTIS